MIGVSHNGLTIMARIFLKVPFAEKDQAKALGARWDGERRSWYVPEGVSSSAFTQWLPLPNRWSARADRYWIVASDTTCWKCQEPTTAFTLALPSGHETLEGDDVGDEWIDHDHLPKPLLDEPLPSVRHETR